MRGWKLGNFILVCPFLKRVPRRATAEHSVFGPRVFTDTIAGGGGRIPGNTNGHARHAVRPGNGHPNNEPPPFPNGGSPRLRSARQTLLPPVKYDSLSHKSEDVVSPNSASVQTFSMIFCLKGKSAAPAFQSIDAQVSKAHPLECIAPHCPLPSGWMGPFTSKTQP